MTSSRDATSTRDARAHNARVEDRHIVAIQLGRPPRAETEVLARCHLGLPVVIRMPPLLDDGTPFPTRYWLTCPLAVTRVGRIEAAGGVRSAQRWVQSDSAAQARLNAADTRYAFERDSEVPPGASPVPRGGVGGAEGDGVKCLHAHYADRAAGNDNPVGEATAPWVEPLDCDVPCVVEADGEAAANSRWREPK